MMAPRPAIPPLTSLRFFAAAVVVAGHFDPDRFSRLPGFFRDWLETGYEAVTFFFVLSGFVLSYVYLGANGGAEKIRLRPFVAARFARLMPAYYFSLLIAVPFFFGHVFFDDEPEPGVERQAVLVLTLLQSWWPEAAAAWNPPAWSLSVEWALYATFPLVLWATRFVSPGALMIGAYLGVCAMALFRLEVLDPLVAEDSDRWHNFVMFFPLWHLPQFVFGAALGRVHLVGPRPAPALAGWLFWAGAFGLMILFAELDELPDRMRSNAVIAIFYGLVIFGAAQSGHVAYRLLSIPPLIFLGEISYATYVLHEPIKFYWDWLGPRTHGVVMPGLVDFTLYFAIVLGVSALCFRYIERPLRRRIRRWGGGQAGDGVPAVRRAVATVPD